MAVAGVASGDPLVHWCTEQLRKTFGLDVSEEIMQYVLSIESAEEIREYVTDLLQGNEGQKGQFIEELVTKWQKNDQELISDPLQQCLKKDEILDGQRSGDQLKRGRRKGRNRQDVSAFAEPDTTIEVKTPFDLAKAQENSNSVKKKTKFVNLYTREGQDRLAVLLPGRHPCDCLGQKHKLINNCLICGRIVCEQEGSGPCLFCGTLVCTHEEQDILQRDSNKSQKLLKKLMSGRQQPSIWITMIETVSCLSVLIYQQVTQSPCVIFFLSIRRTQVIDDESDYFASDSNQWLSKLERETLKKREEELRELRHASRLSKKVTIDFAGRRILKEESPLAEYHSRLDETIQAIANGTLNQPLTKLDRASEDPLGVLVNPSLYQSPPQWVDHTGAASQKKAFHSAGLGLEFNSFQHQLRIQDQEFQEGFDGGWCLSIHQPWASLLVRGIKRVEGRSWYTPHRGRLWIAATAKRPSPQEVSELQATYRLLRGQVLQFPDISQESDSPFVFICKNPQEMVVKFPLKGNPKIWKLDSKIHQGAKKGLMKQNKAV
ncbi:activating signal cointegrator 1 [Otolemur garnettii]|uniref:activating signal cointegrator 1 n=1 Tax=Otolemur garnettii TaxID=30611 RepID=UPI000C7EE59E|nr:activating signal cointegrator 1 [Otolemur garnettii]